MVNTEPFRVLEQSKLDYNILNIVVNTELVDYNHRELVDYNILNIVVNTEPKSD